MEWVSSKRVMEAVGAFFPSCSPEAQRLCTRAKHGLVRTRAKRFCVGEECNDDIDVPANFWWAGGHEALEQDWESGDFSTWIDGEERRAFGVEFAKEDLIAMGVEVEAAPAPSTAPASSGRKADQLRWQVFWFSVLEVAKEGRLTPDHFASANALRDELLLIMGDDAFSPDHVKATVGQIYKRFVTGSAG